MKKQVSTKVAVIILVAVVILIVVIAFAVFHKPRPTLKVDVAGTPGQKAGSPMGMMKAIGGKGPALDASQGQKSP